MCLSCFCLRAQVLLPTPETAFEKQHHFNPEVIKSKNIKRITYDIIDKKDFEVAVENNTTESYDFDNNGKLIRYYYTIVVKTIEREIIIPARYKGKRKIKNAEKKIVNFNIYDTVSTSYFFSGSNLILKRYFDGINYYESRFYRYNSNNQLIKELRYKETNNSKDKSVFILANQLLLSEDSFQYQMFSSRQLKCIYFNSENRPYKEVITNHDSLGRKKIEYENYIAASWIKQEHSYEYFKNRLVMAKFIGNANNDIELKITYEYNTLNNELYSEKHYKNNLLVKEISYITDSNNGLLNSFIIRDPINKSIRIIKLKYEYNGL